MDAEEILEKYLKEREIRLAGYIRDISNRTFETEEVSQLIEDISDTLEHNHSNSKNFQILKPMLSKIQGKIAEYYGCAEKEVLCKDYIAHFKSECPYVVVLGSVTFNKRTKNADKLRIVTGDLHPEDSPIEHLNSLEKIGGCADFESDLHNKPILTKIKSLPKLREADEIKMWDSPIKNLDSLESVHSLSCRGHCLLESAKNLKEAGKIHINEVDTPIKSFPSLEIVSDSFFAPGIESLPNLKSVCKLHIGPSIKSFPLLESADDIQISKYDTKLFPKLDPKSKTEISLPRFTGHYDSLTVEQYLLKSEIVEKYMNEEPEKARFLLEREWEHLENKLKEDKKALPEEAKEVSDKNKDNSNSNKAESFGSSR